jgi:hypothetical protein
VSSFPVPYAQGSEEVRWVVPEKFFDELPVVLESVPPLAGEEALYQLFGSVLDAASSNPDVKKILTEIAVVAERELITPLLQWRLNGPSAGNAWYSPTNNSAFGTDYLIRTALARSNMFENTAAETKYVFTDTDASGEPLDGRSLYTITFAPGQLPPGRWVLVADPLRPAPLFPPQLARPVLAGHQDRHLEKRTGWLLDLVCGRRLARAGQGDELVACPRGSFLPLHQGVLAEPRDD